MDVAAIRRATCTALLAVVVAACGDPATTDDRGYTKAPLENPTVLIRGEQPGGVAQYGAPNRVQAERINLPEQAPAAAAPQTLANVPLPDGVTQDMVTQGETLFGSTGNCFACHGANGAGSPLAPALNESDFLHIDGSYEQLVQIITAGVPNPIQSPAAMPARGGAPLTDEQVRQIAAYVFAISR